MAALIFIAARLKKKTGEFSCKYCLKIYICISLGVSPWFPLHSPVGEPKNLPWIS